MGRKLLVTGGAQRTHAALMRDAHVYREAMLLQVDLDTNEIDTLLTWKTPPQACAEDRPSFVFKAATLHDGRLYLCTQTEVLVLSWPDLQQLRYVSLPCFNDVHHVLPHEDQLLVVSTGLDALAVVDAEDQLVELVSALDEDPWARFDRDTDYRRVASTKPHASHPNFAFVKDGKRWMTRFAQRDAICLDDRSRRIEIGGAGIHDGNVHDGQVQFTRVDGWLAFADAGTDKVVRELDLNRITGSSDPLGWCRGLYVRDDTAYVGFSRIRKTKILKNLAWVKNRGRKAEPRPTRIGIYDLASEAHVRDIDLEPAGMAAVFSILPIPAP